MPLKRWKAESVVILITLIFMGTALGYFVGRNQVAPADSSGATVLTEIAAPTQEEAFAPAVGSAQAVELDESEAEAQIEAAQVENAAILADGRIDLILPI